MWGRSGVAWEEGIRRLRQYRVREGHGRVLRSHKGEVHNFCKWVGDQRANQSTLSRRCPTRLEALGFVWDPIAEAWEEGFSKLQQFHAREGHCRAPQSHKEDGHILGT